MILTRRHKHSALEFAKHRKTQELMDELAAADGAEYRIHCAIVEALDLIRPRITFWHTWNGGKCSPAEAVKRRNQGVRAGVSDLIIALPDRRVIFMEIKSRKGRLSKAQAAFLKSMKACGHYAFVVRSVDDALLVVNALIGLNVRVAA